MAAWLELTVERHDGTTVVGAVGEIDIATAPQLRECLSHVSNDRVIVDLRAVTFLDSSGVGVLAGQYQRLMCDGGKLVLRKPQGMVRTVLEVLGLASWIES